MVLNPALVAQLATLSLSPRLALALFAACRGLSKQAVKAVAQTLLDYTPEDPSVDQEALTLGLNLAGIVHACNATAAAMLRGFCVLLAKQCAALFVSGAVNGEGAEGFVADASLEVARLLYTAFEDCNEVVCDAAVALATGEAEALVHAEAKESEELYEYIEKSMSTRVKVVPAEIRATMADVMSCVLACFAKNVGEEIRANVMYDYQYRSVEVNLAFLLTMAKGVLKDTSAVKERFVDTLNSAFERCYEPGDMEEEVQKACLLQLAICNKQIAQNTIKAASQPTQHSTPHLLLRHNVRKPVKTLIQTIATRSTASLNIPLTTSQLLKSKLLSQIRSRHSMRKILLVSEHQQISILQFLLLKHLVQLVTSIINTSLIVRINHEDQTLSVLVIMSPQVTNLVLTTNIPHSERNVLVLHSLHIETNSRNRSHHLTQLQLVQNSRLTSSIKTNHQDTHILLHLQESSEPITHLYNNGYYSIPFTLYTSYITSSSQFHFHLLYMMTI